MWLKHYRTEPPKVGHLTFWDNLASPGVLQQKDGSLLATLRFRGPDHATADATTRLTHAYALHNLLRRPGAGWGIMTEQRRLVVQDIPTAVFTDPVGRLCAAERHRTFQRPGLAYDTDTTCTLVYRAPWKPPTGWKSFFFTHLPAETIATATLEWFEQEVARFAALLAARCASLTRLEDSALLAFLKSTISLTPQAHVQVPAVPAYLDTYVSDSDVTRPLRWPSLLRWPKLGDHWVRCVGIKGYPPATHPSILDTLADLPVEYRACCRYLPLSQEKAVRELRNYRKAHYGLRKSLGAAALEEVGGSASALLDHASLDWEAEAADAQAAVRRGEISYGYLTQTAVVWDMDFAEATAKAERVAHTLNAAGFVAKVETLNTMDAWVGTFPGNMYANVRRPLLHSKNLAHLFPASAPWRGPERNAHLGGPPLLRTVGSGYAPFNLDTYDGDVGMAYIAGPIGSGKSTALAIMAQQWMQYPGAEVKIIDTGQSLRCMTYAMGGQWYDVAAELERGTHSARKLDDADAELWGSPWLPPPARWQCFEMGDLLKTPAVLATIMRPLLHTLKERMTGAPTLFIFDEGHLYLLHDVLLRGIDDYVRGVRKLNGAVLFATQSIADAARSELAPIISDSSMTRMYLPNYHALEPETAKIYQGWGLSETQCQVIAEMVPKQDYYFQGREGHRIFQLHLGPAALAFAGAGRKEDLAAMAQLYAGDAHMFSVAWLHHRGLHREADRLKSLEDVWSEC